MYPEHLMYVCVHGGTPDLRKNPKIHPDPRTQNMYVCMHGGTPEHRKHLEKMAKTARTAQIAKTD